MVLPIILIVVGTVIQIALLANASLVVRYSAFAAARSAIVRFEYETVASATDKLLIEPAQVDQVARLPESRWLPSACRVSSHSALRTCRASQISP